MRGSPVICAIAFAVALHGGDVVLPDPRTGNVNGLVGVLYWPGTAPVRAREPSLPLATAEGCQAHLVPETDPEQELKYPCGRWFAPPAGKYLVWLETAGGISPTQNMLVYAGTPFRGGGLPAIAAIVPAGRAGIGRALPANESVRLFSIRTTRPWAKSVRIFDRRLKSRVVQMPAGDPVILGRFDRKTNDAIALSRPVQVNAGETQLVWPAEPAASDVLVILRKPPALQLRKEPPSARLLLHDGKRGREADVLANGGDRIVAIWYGVDAPRAKVSFESDAAQWEPRDIRLSPGKVTTIRDEVKPLPSARVSIPAPSGARLPEEVFLEVSRVAERVAEKEPLRRVPASAGIHELPELPAELLHVTLRIGQWEWVENLDLTRGDDGHVVFELEPINISGTVFHGDDPAPAEISFRNGDDRWAVVRTDEKGRYETTLWWPDVQTARVTLVGKRLPPFLDPFREIFESGRVDFHVPRTDYRVRIRDARTGRGIAGARVTAGNETPGGMQLAQHVITDAEGEAILSPLRAGELIVSVQAERYAGIEPRRVVVDDRRHELEIVLQPLQTAGQLRVVLPNGAAAADAEVWALDPAMNPVWRGRSTPDGLFELPDAAAGALLLLRHPQAASSARRWSDGDTWTLEPPARPLTLTTDPSAPIAVWLDGVKLAGPALSFATWSGPSANPQGLWVGRNLPARALPVLAGNRVDTIDYPWR